ncbi:MAG TPA: PaaI family thioesterase [Polyangiaceae bacterium LLY-WYZ-14_1]|nr:PaaI family thioesterase [Polyangiaceae bacterium LLY-WYZ-14_1]
MVDRPPVTGGELVALLKELFPARESTGLGVEGVGDGELVVRQPLGPGHLRPGGTVSGPTLMTLVDTAVYLALLARDRRYVAAVTSDLHARFLRRPSADADLLARARLLRVGRSLATAVVEVESEGGGLVAHATVAYALPPLPDDPRRGSHGSERDEQEGAEESLARASREPTGEGPEG